MNIHSLRKLYHTGLYHHLDDTRRLKCHIADMEYVKGILGFDSISKAFSFHMWSRSRDKLSINGIYIMNVVFQNYHKKEDLRLIDDGFLFNRSGRMTLMNWGDYLNLTYKEWISYKSHPVSSHIKFSTIPDWCKHLNIPLLV